MAASVAFDNYPQLLSETFVQQDLAPHEVIEISSDEEDALDCFTSDQRYPCFTASKSGAEEVISIVDGEPSAKQSSPFDIEIIASRTKRKWSSGAQYLTILDHKSTVPIEDGRFPMQGLTSTDTNSATKPQAQNVDHTPGAIQHEDGLDAQFLYELTPVARNRRSKKAKIAPKISVTFNTSKTLGKRPKQAPYYDDAKLGVRMYRGPGFERFPIPLENPQHRMICDLWDKRQIQKSKRCELSWTSYGVDASTSTETPDPIAEDHDEPENDSKLSSGDLECLSQVLEVLPDVSYQFVLDVIELMTVYLMEDIEQIPSPNDVVARIMEFEDYPKEAGDHSEINETGMTIKVARENGEQPNYQRDATILLAEEFDFVPTHYIQKAVKEKKSLYDAFVLLAKSEADYQSSVDTQHPYKRLRQPRLNLEKKYARKPNAQRNQGQWLNLISELQAAKQQTTRKEIKAKEQKVRESLETANLQEHIANGNIIECQCCFDDEIPTNRSVSCQAEAAHLYCFQCIERLAGVNTGSGKYEMTCMSQCGCKAQLDPDGVTKAVPTSILRKLAFNQQQAEVDAADIEGLDKCPHCDFKGICDPVDIDPVFSCLDPDCGKVTCRLCLERAHSPKTCEQVKKEKGLLASRHQIEEARSQAMMRTCPRCKKRTIKEAGCNKVTCTCGCMSCFVCQKDITKEMYRHFGAPPKCPQSDNFDRHQFDADQAEKLAIERIRVRNPELEEKDLTIEGVAKLTKLPRRPDQPRNNALGIIPAIYHQAPDIHVPDFTAGLRFETHGQDIAFRDLDHDRDVNIDVPWKHDYQIQLDLLEQMQHRRRREAPRQLEPAQLEPQLHVAELDHISNVPNHGDHYLPPTRTLPVAMEFEHQHVARETEIYQAPLQHLVGFQTYQFPETATATNNDIPDNITWGQWNTGYIP